MRKSTIMGTWLVGLVAIIAGLIAAAVGTTLIFAAGGTYGGPTGQEFIPTLDAFFWWMIALASTGAFFVLVGVIVQLVAWIGAVVNTYASTDKTWFVVLLIGGLLAFVGVVIAPFAVMLAYLIAGPDTHRPETRTEPLAQPPTLAPAR